MNRRLVLKALIEKGFNLSNDRFYTEKYFEINEQDNINKLKEVNDSYGFNIFTNKGRVLIVKTYVVLKEAYLQYKEDQKVIYSMLHNIKNKYKKNIYLIINIDDKYKNTECILRSLIEKDELVCKKYVVYDENDFNKISFLSEELDCIGVGIEQNKDIESEFLNLVNKHCKKDVTKKIIEKYLIELSTEQEGE
ncbi:ABC-three component system middle component 1 [Clostridium gasigenes]|uniref:Uncharacterized protein n=1 Tax=Clostridium gasigenes TaxID=94869 RepID=A0A1H0LTD7_9CLOT|nr:ABC-three component system middle component 1 [Clostridium gasigenes]SDO71365.1 hypothetical protein SAMN04488529_101194 [Clostridium gasigenes]